ncbi:hypothetical protein CHUAL_005336 [Chamberlinius hualienensis]
MWTNQLILIFIAVFGIKAIRKQPPRDYPYLSHIPKTSFDCKKHPVGYYADPLTKCQVYHMCDMKGNKFSYLCPNGTLFHQQLLICAHWYQVNCTKSLKLYEVNKVMFPYEKYPEDRLHKHQEQTQILQPQVLHTQLLIEDSQTQQSVQQTHVSQEIFKRIQPEFEQPQLQPILQTNPQVPQIQLELLQTETQDQQLNHQPQVQPEIQVVANEQPRNNLPPNFNSQIQPQVPPTRSQFAQLHHQPLLDFPTTTTTSFIQPSRRTFPPFSQFRAVSQSRTLAPSILISNSPNGQLQLSTQPPVQNINNVAIDRVNAHTESTAADSVAKENKNDVPGITESPEQFSTPWWSQLHNPINSQQESDDDDDDVEDASKNDMKFPQFGIPKILSRLPVNSECPLCHPHFVQDGHCSPCVVIR